MTNKRKKRSRRMPILPALRPQGIRLTTPEGDDFVFAKATYQHAAPEQIRQVLQRADDFGIDDELQPDPAGSYNFPWLETTPKRSRPVPIGQRVLAQLTLTPTTLEIDAMSLRRLNACRRRLERLLGDRIRLVGTEVKDMEQAPPRTRGPRPEPEEPFVPPPEMIAEIEEKMLRQWIDDSIPALGGLTPRQAVRTPEGRQQVLELIEHAGRMQRKMPKTPGVFAPDYRKVKKMLGLE